MKTFVKKMSEETIGTHRQPKWGSGRWRLGGGGWSWLPHKSPIVRESSDVVQHASLSLQKRLFRM